MIGDKYKIEACVIYGVEDKEMRRRFWWKNMKERGQSNTKW
jgi:hypothetical protein